NLNKMVEPVKLANSSSNTAQGLSARSQPKAKPQFYYLVMSEKFSWLEFHQELKCAGLTKKRAAFQTRIGELVEGVAAAVVGISGESYYDWMMTGSFVEGWGNNLFRLDGVTGVDSDIDWSQVVKHKVYHLRSTCHSVVDCINRKDYELKNGHIVVKNSSQQPAFDTKRHGLRPDTDECHAYPCCSYPATVLDDDQDEVNTDRYPVCDKFQQIIKTQFDNENPIEDVHFVRASVPGEVNQLRLSCTRQERFIMSQLSTVQGQLFTVLKYLFKTKEDERNPKSEKKIIESVKSYHAKTLLMKLLRDRDSWPANGHDDDVEEDEEASKRLERLVWRGLGFLLRSITTNLQAAEAGEEPSGDSKEPPQSPSRQASVASSSASTKSSNSKVPRVLDHALLKDCGLYLKPKKPKEATKSSKSSILSFIFRSPQEQPKKAISAIEAHASALEEMKEDLLGLIGKRGDMDDVLAETPGILWERGSSAVSDLNRELKKLNEPELKMVLEKFEKLTQSEIESMSQSKDTSQGQGASRSQGEDTSQGQGASRSQSLTRSESENDMRQREEKLRKKIANLYGKLGDTYKLYDVLKDYQTRVTSTSDERKKHGKKEDVIGDEAQFLFIPLAMLPRITLDTLLDEKGRRLKKEKTTGAAEGSTTGAGEGSTTGAAEGSTNEPFKDSAVDQKAINELKKAYIKVWIVLRSLSDSERNSSEPSQTQGPSRSQDAGQRPSDSSLQKAKQWIKNKAFLKTTWLCLEIMENLKNGHIEEVKRLLRETDCQPTRWIKPEKDYDFAKLLREKDCVWIFHYFIRPNIKISYNYLNDVQNPVERGTKIEKRTEYEKGEGRVFEYINGVRKDWLIHLVVNQDDKKSRQPSLTVNFDGLLDRFRRRFGDGNVDVDSAAQIKDDDYLDTMKNCLFDPREAERLEAERLKNHR
ncbi:hypothetical protein BOX15_Mlig007158g4, partial [Macrostomum lignano]